MEVPSIFLNKILAEAAKRNASSLHLTVGSSPAMRVNGQLAAMEGESMATAEMIDKIINSFASEEEKGRLAEEKELILVKTFAGSFRFRVNIFYQKGFPSLSFHYISENIKSLADLKLPSLFNGLLKAKSGLFVVAGSYGSGKTTTAAAFIEEINKNFKNRIITIEDPIENLFISKKSFIEQRQVGLDAKSAADGLSYCLEEDVDLVYIGRIKENFEAAAPLILDLAAGNTFVLLELNADSAISAVDKILNSLRKKSAAEAAQHNLADVLAGVMAQKLVPRVGGGMVLAPEILIATSAVKSLIREGKIYQLESIIQTGRKEGMVSMSKSLEELLKTGEIKQEDAGGF